IVAADRSTIHIEQMEPGRNIGSDILVIVQTVDKDEIELAFFSGKEHGRFEAWLAHDFKILESGHVVEKFIEEPVRIPGNALHILHFIHYAGRAAPGIDSCNRAGTMF